MCTIIIYVIYHSPIKLILINHYNHPLVSLFIIHSDICVVILLSDLTKLTMFDMSSWSSTLNTFSELDKSGRLDWLDCANKASDLLPMLRSRNYSIIQIER